MLSSVISLKKNLLQILKADFSILCSTSTAAAFCTAFVGLWGIKRIQLTLCPLITPYGSGQDIGNLHFGVECKFQVPGARIK